MRQKPPLTIKKLIELLEPYKEIEWTIFDFGGYVPQPIPSSYRGNTADISIGYYEQDFIWAKILAKQDTSYMTKVGVNQLLEELKSVIDTTLYGYKGGYHKIKSTSKVWAANSGECSGTAIIGVRLISDWQLMLVTGHYEL